MGIQELPPKSCHDLREADPSIPHIDVRTPEEFAAGHPRGAVNIPIFFATDHGMAPNEQFAAAVKRIAPDPAQRVIFNCKMGGRSAKACEEVQAAGYENPVNMRGGFSGARSPGGDVIEPGWSESGLPVSTEVGDRGWDSLAPTT